MTPMGSALSPFVFRDRFKRCTELLQCNSHRRFVLAFSAPRRDFRPDLTQSREGRFIRAEATLLHKWWARPVTYMDADVACSERSTIEKERV